MQYFGHLIFSSVTTFECFGKILNVFPSTLCRNKLLFVNTPDRAIKNRTCLNEAMKNCHYSFFPNSTTMKVK